MIVQNKSQIKLESLTKEQKDHFHNTDHCEMCNVKFISSDRKKIKILITLIILEVLEQFYVQCATCSNNHKHIFLYICTTLQHMTQNY